MRILRYILLALLLLAAVYVGWWLFGRSADQEVLAAQTTFLVAVEDRDWKDVKAMLADDFATRVGHNRDTAIADAQQVLGQFLTLTLTPEGTAITATPKQATVEMKIQIAGTGSALSQIILARAKEMRDPWSFQWQKKGRWPWNWKIVSIHHPDLPPPQQ